MVFWPGRLLANKMACGTSVRVFAWGGCSNVLDEAMTKPPRKRGLSRKKWDKIWLKVTFNPWWNDDRKTIEKNIERLVEAALRRRKS